MNKLIALCGLVMLGTTTTPQDGNDDLECNEQVVEMTRVSAEGDSQFAYTAYYPTVTATPEKETRIAKELPEEVNLDDIVFIEEESEIDLGFDTKEYLPEGFDPYKQFVDLKAIDFIEEEDTMDLGFDTSVYLPKDFNPYAYPTDVMSIDYIEEGEDDIDLGFDTADYLPEGFDPHDIYVDLDAIEYYDDEDLGPNFWTIDYILSL